MIGLLVIAALLVVQRCRTSDPPASGFTEPPGECRVTRLADGDSLTCADGSRLRLIGIDAPELAQPPFGRRSQDALDAMIGGKTLRLTYDIEARDEFGRLLAYAWLGSTFVNESMVRNGWAVAFKVPPNDLHYGRLRAAEQEARADELGHWPTGGFECRPIDHRHGRC